MRNHRILIIDCPELQSRIDAGLVQTVRLGALGEGGNMLLGAALDERMNVTFAGETLTAKTTPVSVFY